MNKQKQTGYPSIDKPWLKYYTEENILAPLPHMTAYEYLRDKNKEHLNLTAITSDSGNYTYEELFAMIDKTASSLYELGIKKGKIVLCMLPVLPHESFIFYGVDRVGAAMSQLPPQSTIDEICNAITKFDAEIFFVFDTLITSEMEQIIYQNTNLKSIIQISFLPSKTRNERTISWDDFLEIGAKTRLPIIKRKPEDLLFIAGTGGTTGTPKNVMLNDNCFNIIVHQFINSDVPYDYGDRWMRLWPLFSATAAVANSHMPLCIGMNVFLHNLSSDITCFAKMILDDKPNHLILIPQLLDELEQSTFLGNSDLSFVKTAGCGGIAMTSQFEKRVNQFYKKHKIETFLGHGWGCTENASNIAMRSNFATTRVGTVGAPMVNTVVSAFDSTTEKELKYDEVGELCVQSPTIMMGYWKDQESTEKVIKKHADGSIWLHTGDLGSISKDGIVTVSGRMTRVIFVSPTAKIYPQAVENMLSKIPGIREVAVCEIPDLEHDGFYRLVYFIVPDKGYNLEDIRNRVNELCADELPEYSRPRKIFFKEAFPLTKVGKVDYRALESLVSQETGE